jgi:hypothetical protein
MNITKAKSQQIILAVDFFFSMAMSLNEFPIKIFVFDTLQSANQGADTRHKSKNSTP